MTRRNGQKRSLWARLGQKSVGCMKDLVNKFFKSGELVADRPSGMAGTVRACMELLRHHGSLGCAADAECFAASTEIVIDTYEIQALNEKLDIFGMYDVMDTCKMVVWALNRLQARKRIRSWKVSAALFRCRCYHLTSGAFFPVWFWNSLCSRESFRFH